MDKIRLLIIEDHTAVRRALADRMRSSTRFEIVATARNLEDGMRQARELHPDVILLELKGSAHKSLNPIGLIQAATNSHPASIIVLTSYADESEREAALRSGARHYLLKEIDSDRLIAEIETVVADFRGSTPS